MYALGMLAVSIILETKSTKQNPTQSKILKNSRYMPKSWCNLSDGPCNSTQSPSYQGYESSFLT